MSLLIANTKCSGIGLGAWGKRGGERGAGKERWGKRGGERGVGNTDV